jgi:hypothetical protein
MHAQLAALAAVAGDLERVEGGQGRHPIRGCARTDAATRAERTVTGGHAEPSAE